jgi:TolB protein
MRGPVRLTHSEATDYHPVWSADGEEVLFVSDRGGDLGIWSIAANGGEPALVWDGPGRDDHPFPSPNGAWLAFSSDESGERALRLLSLESGRTLTLVSGPVVAWPSWSPDGTMIAFVAGTESSMDICVVRAPPLPLP